MTLKTIKTLPHPDRGIWWVFEELMRAFGSQVRWRGKLYRFETGVVRPAPIRCGQNLRAVADLLLDHGSHYWSPFFRNWSQTAVNSGVQFLNNGISFRRLDKHHAYDLLCRAMHPLDRHPKTVLLPEHYPHTKDQEDQAWWQEEQRAVAASTELGFDARRRSVDRQRVERILADRRLLRARVEEMRQAHYPTDNYLRAVVEDEFESRFPLYLKPAFGRGGRGVRRLESLEQLYAEFDRTGGEAYHLQEAVEEYDIYVRCMGIGPQVLVMEYLPEKPHHLHYAEALPRIGDGPDARLRHYTRFNNAFHRWNHNSFEAAVRGSSLHPIDYANACPDSSFLSLHVFFPWLLCALVRWCTFVVVAEVDLRIDLEQQRFVSLLNDPGSNAEEKYAVCEAWAREYYRIEDFHEYCATALPELELAAHELFAENTERLVTRLIRTSDFPPHEHDRFIGEYLEKMRRVFLPSSRRYLTSGVPS